MATLESKQAENEEASAQLAELMAEAEQRRAQGEELRTSLQTQRAALGRTADRQRTDSHSGDHRLHRGR